MKIVINSEYGGFGLSDDAIREYFRNKNWTVVEEKDERGYTHFYKDAISDDNYFHEHSVERNDPDLVAVVEKLGKDADAQFSRLKIVEIPDDVDWYVEEYDGLEWVAEAHRTWR